MAIKRVVKVKVRTKKSSMKKSLPAMGTDCFDSCKGQCTKGTPCSSG